MTDIEELQVKTRIVSAELALVERVRWGVAVLSALYMEAAAFHSWPIPIGIGIAVFMMLPHWHRKRYNQAWDAYEKATGTGNFATPEAEKEKDAGKDAV